VQEERQVPVQGQESALLFSACVRGSARGCGRSQTDINANSFSVVFLLLLDSNSYSNTVSFDPARHSHARHSHARHLHRPPLSRVRPQQLELTQKEQPTWMAGLLHQLQCICFPLQCIAVNGGRVQKDYGLWRLD
jgi:hypothetical protein